MKDLELKPHEYSSDREKPREPFFGPGAPDALGYLIGLVLTVALIHMLR